LPSVLLSLSVLSDLLEEWNEELDRTANNIYPPPQIPAWRERNQENFWTLPDRNRSVPDKFTFYSVYMACAKKISSFKLFYLERLLFDMVEWLYASDQQIQFCYVNCQLQRIINTHNLLKFNITCIIYVSLYHWRW